MPARNTNSGPRAPALREGPNPAPAGHLRRAPRAAPRRCVRAHRGLSRRCGHGAAVPALPAPPPV